MFSDFAYQIFEECIKKYHLKDDVSQSFDNPYPKEDVAHLLYRKNWIDTVQWHLEDLIRDPKIAPAKAIVLKRKIDASNQDRTDLVEFLDSYFLTKYHLVQTLDNATINTESPAWALDRLSILALKIYHMQEETKRSDANADHVKKCKDKLAVLMEQQADLSRAIDQLLDDIAAGKKYMKVYKQMKMYNDEELNPVLRGTK